MYQYIFFLLLFAFRDDNLQQMVFAATEELLNFISQQNYNICFPEHEFLPYHWLLLQVVSLSVLTYGTNNTSWHSARAAIIPCHVFYRRPHNNKDSLSLMQQSLFQKISYKEIVERNNS
jgi:hypothetical protein